MSHQSAKKDFPFCLNCQTSMVKEDKFCGHCGQKATDGRTSIHDLFHEFIHTWLHVDGKFFSTALHLFVPGKLTVEFFKGRQKRYAHPVQLFFLLTAASLAISTLSTKSVSKIIKMELEVARSIAISKEYKSEFMETVHQNAQNKPTLQAWADSVLIQTDTAFRKKLEKQKQEETEKSIKNSKNTADFFEGFNATQTTPKPTASGEKEVSIFGMKVKNSDLLLLSDNELVEKYQPNSSIKKIFLTSVAHVFQKGGDFLSYFNSKMLWVSIFIAPILAFVLFGLYRRHHKFYVEHLVFILHWAAFNAVMTIVSALLMHYNFTILGLIAGYFVPYLYLLFAMRNFYDDSKKRKLGIKFLIFVSLHTFISVLGAFIALFVSAYLF